MGILLFLAAGTFAWPGAWAYLVLMVLLSLTLGIGLARHDPGLFRERMGSPVQRDQPAADKLLLIALLFFIFAWLVLMGLDAKRFAWSSVPAVMQLLGALIMLWSIWFCYRAMRENSFAAPVIKLQQERGQRVISTGPYAFVRHPMYFGAAFYFIGTALLLLEARRGLERARATSSWLRTTGALRGSVTILRGRTRSGFSSVTVKKNRSAVMAALIVPGLACCCAIWS